MDHVPGPLERSSRLTGHPCSWGRFGASVWRLQANEVPVQGRAWARGAEGLGEVVRERPLGAGLDPTRSAEHRRLRVPSPLGSSCCAPITRRGAWAAPDLQPHLRPGSFPTRLGGKSQGQRVGQASHPSRSPAS